MKRTLSMAALVAASSLALHAFAAGVPGVDVDVGKNASDKGLPGVEMNVGKDGDQKNIDTNKTDKKVASADKKVSGSKHHAAKKDRN